MRSIRGTMMDAVVPQPGDLDRLHAQFLAAALPDPSQPHHKPLAWAPASRIAAWQSVSGQLAGRHLAQSLQAGRAWPSMVFDLQAWQEGAAIAQAALQQWASLQTAWVAGLTEITDEMAQLRRANTVSKHVDQEVNLVQQSMALVSSQVTACARWSENLQNNLAFWMSQRANAGPVLETGADADADREAAPASPAALAAPAPASPAARVTATSTPTPARKMTRARAR